MDRLVLAYNFAAEKHRDQRRKDSHKSPYINHPIHVTSILSSVGVTDIDTLIAGVLHDTVEDTDTSYEEIEKLFGKNVSNIVAECSDDKSLDKVKRKQLQIEHSAHISDSAKLVKMADKYSNISGFDTDPPANWSGKEIFGYKVWGYHVCEKIRGVNVLLDDKMYQLLHKSELGDTEYDLSCRLDEYYTLLRNK